MLEKRQKAKLQNLIQNYTNTNNIECYIELDEGKTKRTTKKKTNAMKPDMVIRIAENVAFTFYANSCHGRWLGLQ